MHSSRAFNKGRNIFGTRLLQMNPNNILKLCHSSKFHYSTRMQETKAQLYDYSLATTTMRNSNIQLDSFKQLCEENKDVNEILTSLGIDLAVIRDILAKECWTPVSLKKTGMSVEVIKQIKPCTNE